MHRFISEDSLYGENDHNENPLGLNLAQLPNLNARYLGHRTSIELDLQKTSHSCHNKAQDTTTIADDSNKSKARILSREDLPSPLYSSPEKKFWPSPNSSPLDFGNIESPHRNCGLVKVNLSCDLLDHHGGDEGACMSKNAISKHSRLNESVADFENLTLNTGRSVHLDQSISDHTDDGGHNIDTNPDLDNLVERNPHFKAFLEEREKSRTPADRHNKLLSQTRTINENISSPYGRSTSNVIKSSVEFITPICIRKHSEQISPFR